MEHVGEQALVLRVQLSKRDDGVLDAQAWLWEGDLFGPSTELIVKTPAAPLTSALAAELLEAIQSSATVAICPPFEVWIHPITHRLELQAGSNSNHFVWQSELPEGWSQLARIVGLLKHIASIHASNVQPVAAADGFAAR